MKVLSALLLMTFMGMIDAVALPSNDGGCPLEGGRIADESDCGSYFDCIKDADGKVTRHSRSCFGRAFDPETLTCTKMSKVQGCRLRQGRYYVTSSRYQDICKNESVHFACGDCMTYITCSEGKAYEEKCQSNMRCVMNKEGFEGGVCHVDYEEKCSCTEENQHRVDPYYNGMFFICDGKDSTPKYFDCPYNTYFNETLKKCMNYDGSPLCTAEGSFNYPENCSKYYSCTQTQKGWIQNKMACETGKLFNELSGECEDPCNWPPKKFKCTVQGRFKNPEDCSSYFECIALRNGTILPVLRSCPPNHHWNDESEICVRPYNSRCKIPRVVPLEKCERDYLAICENKPNERPQIEETPQNKPSEGGEDDNDEDSVNQVQPSPPETSGPEVSDQNESQPDAETPENVEEVPSTDVEDEEETSDTVAEGEDQEETPGVETEETTDRTPLVPAPEDEIPVGAEEEAEEFQPDQETDTELTPEESENEVVPENVQPEETETIPEEPEAGLDQTEGDRIPVIVGNAP